MRQWVPIGGVQTARQRQDAPCARSSPSAPCRAAWRSGATRQGALRLRCARGYRPLAAARSAHARRIRPRTQPQPLAMSAAQRCGPSGRAFSLISAPFLPPPPADNLGALTAAGRGPCGTNFLAAGGADLVFSIGASAASATGASSAAGEPGESGRDVSGWHTNARSKQPDPALRRPDAARRGVGMAVGLPCPRAACWRGETAAGGAGEAQRKPRRNAEPLTHPARRQPQRQPQP